MDDFYSSKEGVPNWDLQYLAHRAMDRSKNMLECFVQESNMIESIIRQPNKQEIDAHWTLVRKDELTVKDIEEFVIIVAQQKLRTLGTDNVWAGGYERPSGGPKIKQMLKELLDEINFDKIHPYEAHVRYELLHPFLDGNGRSGRAIWLWQMVRFNYEDPFLMSFLRRYYYQSLDAERKNRER